MAEWDDEVPACVYEPEEEKELRFRQLLKSTLAEPVTGGEISKMEAVIRRVVDDALGEDQRATTTLFAALMKIYLDEDAGDAGTPQEKEDWRIIQRFLEAYKGDAKM